MTTTAEWPAALTEAWQRTNAESPDDAALVDGFLHLLDTLYSSDQDLEAPARDYVLQARRADRPAWVAAARSVWALGLWRADNEDSALLQLVLAELDLQEQQRRPRPEPTGGPLGTAVASNNLGVVYVNLRLYELATPHLRRAAELSQAHYAPPLHLQVAADIANLAETSVRRALYAITVGQQRQASQDARAGLAEAQRLMVWAQRLGRDDTLRYARALVIGARSVTEPHTLRDADRDELLATLAQPVFGERPCEIVIRSILARVARLVGDPAQCRMQAAAVADLRDLGDEGSRLVALREAAMLDDTSEGAWAFARAMAQDSEAARRRMLTAFRGRLALAGLEQRYEEVAEERQRLRSALEQTRRQEAALVHAATHDSLTGLATRSLFEQRLANLLDQDDDDVHALACIDIDDFQAINDAHGHAAGDEVLRWLATHLRGAVRETDTVARLGGDEFALLATSLHTTDLQEWAQRLMAAVHDVDDRPHRVSISVGICQISGAQTVTEAVHLADAQMYRAKDLGKARFCIAPPHDSSGQA